MTNAPLGKDVLALLRKSCDKYGIKLALYFSEGDWSWTGAKDGAVGGTGSGIEIQRAQLKELCTQYGPIEYFWMDCAAGHPDGSTHQQLNDWVKSFQPGCFVGCNDGKPGDGADLRIGERGHPGKVPPPYLVGEFTYPILPEHQGGAAWFYSLPKHDALCLQAYYIYKEYRGAVKNGNIFSLDLGPDYAGKLRQIDVETLRKVGGMIKNPPPVPPPLSSGKPAKASSTWHEPGYEAAKAFDDNDDTRWGAAEGERSGWLEVDLGKESRIGRVVVKELYYRIQECAIEYQDAGTWKELVRGTTLFPGEMEFKFPPVSARHVRLNILKASNPPTIQEFQVYQDGK